MNTDLNRNLVVTIKDGYTTSDVELILKLAGGNVTNVSGNTVEATGSYLLINHIKSMNSVASVSIKGEESKPTPTPNPAPAPTPTPQPQPVRPAPETLENPAEPRSRWSWKNNS